MAAGLILVPGDKYGPCADDTCGHQDCSQWRTMAYTSCGICEQSLGYAPDKGRRFYDDREYGLVHASCLEDLVALRHVKRTSESE